MKRQLMQAYLFYWLQHRLQIYSLKWYKLLKKIKRHPPQLQFSIKILPVFIFFFFFFFFFDFDLPKSLGFFSLFLSFSLAALKKIDISLCFILYSLEHGSPTCGPWPICNWAQKILSCVSGAVHAPACHSCGPVSLLPPSQAAKLPTPHAPKAEQ